MNCLDVVRKFQNMSIYDEHYRRFIDRERLTYKLKGLGYDIIYEEENNGFSKNGVSDPTLLRIVARYKAD